MILLKANSLPNYNKPKFFEILETTYENADGDVWSAELLEGQNHPMSDAIFFNEEMHF